MCFTFHFCSKYQPPPPPDCESVYYDSSKRAHYCELNGLHQAYHSLPVTRCHTHGSNTTRASDVTSARSADVSDTTSDAREYFLKAEPDLFCTIDRSTYERNNTLNKLKQQQNLNISPQRNTWCQCNLRNMHELVRDASIMSTLITLLSYNQ